MSLPRSHMFFHGSASTLEELDLRTEVLWPPLCSQESTYLGYLTGPFSCGYIPKGTTVSSFLGRIPRATVGMTFHTELVRNPWKKKRKSVKLSHFQRSCGAVDLLCILETWFQEKFHFSLERSLLNVSVDFMAPVWRLPGVLCCCDAAGDNSMASQTAPSTNPSLCLPCKSQISAWVAEMRQIMLYLMTYLMAHFPEVMRTYNYPCAQCELWLLCKQKVQTKLPHFKQVKVKKTSSLRSFSFLNLMSNVNTSK